MWLDLAQALLAILVFVLFPFAVLAAGAAVLMLFDRLFHHHNGRHALR